MSKRMREGLSSGQNLGAGTKGHAMYSPRLCELEYLLALQLLVKTGSVIMFILQLPLTSCRLQST